jgi:hypothetical protein
MTVLYISAVKKYEYIGILRTSFYVLALSIDSSDYLPTLKKINVLLSAYIGHIYKVTHSFMSAV